MIAISVKSFITYQTYDKEDFSMRKHHISLCLNHFFERHPWISLLLAGVIIPLLMLAAVAAVTVAVMLPISYFMGWPL